MKKLIVLVSLVSTVFTATTYASPSQVTCSVINAEGKTTKSLSFIASRPGQHSVEVVKGKALYFRWNYYTSPLYVRMVANPHYPWNFSIFENVLGRAQFTQNNRGKIDGIADISVLAKGYKLVCIER